MTTLKTLLFLTIVILSFETFAQSVACLYKDQIVAPAVAERTTINESGVVVDTAAWTAWKLQAGTATQIEATKSLTCCADLSMNPTSRVCLDKSMIDPSLVTCKADADCSGDQGCFPMREDDMFKLDDNSSEAQVDKVTALQEVFEQQQDEVDDPKGPGQNCTRNMDCESYNCQRKTGAMFAICVAPQNICRLADLNEMAVGKVKCEAPLLPDPATAKCYDPSLNTFKGPLGVMNIAPADIQNPNKCQFALVPTAPGATRDDVRPAIDLAIGTTRGLEWLFATTSHSGDCMKVIDYLKEKVLEQVTIRKEILRDYSLNTKVIEENFALVNAAKKDDMTPIRTLCGDTTTNHDVALRRATGLDYLCYMKERNKVFSLYEADMLIWTSNVNKIIDTYKEKVFSWDENSKGDWSIGEKGYNWRNPKCRYYINLLLGVITPKKYKKRWHQKYNASSHKPTNDILNSAIVRQHLTAIGDDNTVKQMQSGYFLDPVMPGGEGMDFEKFGNGEGMFQPSLVNAHLSATSPVAFVATNLIGGIGNGPKYNRNLRNGEFASMYSRYQTKLNEYMMGLRLDVAEADFITEPEMAGSYEYRGCMSHIEDPKCAGFKKHVGKIRDIAFAQFLAYSKHSKSKYKSYYKSEGTFRKKLWNRYAVDLANLQNYYTALSKLRAAQNVCIDKVIAQLQGGDFHVDQAGITEGANNYYVPTESNSSIVQTGEIKTKPVISKTQDITPYKISLSVYNRSLKDGGLTDSLIGKSTGGGAADLYAAATGSLATRNQDIASANSKAQAAGFDVNKSDADLRASLKQASAKTGSASGSNAAGGSGSSNSASGSGASGNKATLDGDTDGSSSSSSNANGVNANGTSGSGSAIPGSGLAAGVGAGVGAVSVGGSDALGTSDAASGAAHKEDATGMSDEEKDRMAANYDRTKNQYKTSEDDSLFQVVSKTYVRNLDKVLTRKKKLDEDAASAPSTPSTP